MYRIYVYDELTENFVDFLEEDSLEVALQYLNDINAPACVANGNLQLFIHNESWQQSPHCPVLIQYWQDAVRAQWQ